MALLKYKPYPFGDTHNFCKDTQDGYYCTRTVGHKGPHAAHGGPFPPYRVWSRDHKQLAEKPKEN